MKNLSSILIFIIGLVLSVLAQQYWAVGYGFISCLSAAMILYVNHQEFLTVAKEGMGYLSLADSYRNTLGRELDMTTFNESFFNSLLAIIMALTLYSL